jgi:hypothetical protein
MLLYCFITYLICLGILIDEHDHLDEWSSHDIICFILSPFIVPIITGMAINSRKNYE